MERNALKSLLKSIKEKDYAVPEGIKPFELALEMAEYIGDVEGELRDVLVYSTLFNWIVKDVLTGEEIRTLLHICLDEEHLLYGIGKVDDSVFIRTFSVLIVATGVYKHRLNNFLSQEEVINILDKTIKFYDEDRDVRGYIDGKGWAHGAAHGADVLDELARCPEIECEGLRRILASIYRKVNNPHYGYIHEEDERIVTAVMGVLERTVLTELEIIEWVKRFENMTKSGIQIEDFILQVNVKNFLRCLYFRMKDKGQYITILREVEGLLARTKRF